MERETVFPEGTQFEIVSFEREGIYELRTKGGEAFLWSLAGNRIWGGQTIPFINRNAIRAMQILSDCSPTLTLRAVYIP